MKKIKFAYFLCMALFTNAFTSAAQNLDNIIAKHIDAIGGRDNWNKLKTMRTESSMKSNGAEIVFIGTSVKNKGTRSDVMLMGMSGWSIVTKEVGWSLYPWAGQTKAEAMTADDLKMAVEELDMLEDFLTYKEKGKSIDFYGMEDVDGTECYKIKMIDKNQKESTYFIDPDTYMTIKITTKVKSNGQENEYSTFYSNYEKLPEGIVMPMSNTNGWSENRVNKIEINVPVDEKIFIPAK
jgi:hypothetical protein